MDRYQIQTDNQTTDTAETIEADGSTAATIEGLNNRDDYRFRARAHSDAGYGPWSGWSPSVTPCGTAFSDVAAIHPFFTEIEWLATTGFPDGGFHPTSNVTRQAMAAFLTRCDLL